MTARPLLIPEDLGSNVSTFIYLELFVVEKTLNEKRCPVMVDPYLKNYVYNSGSRTRTIVIKRKFTYHQTPTNTTKSSFLAETAQRFDEKNVAA